jgi:hypothetical protein
MDDFDTCFDEGSDLDNWETEQVFQDNEGDDDFEPDTDDPGVYGPSEDSYLDSLYEDRFDCEG